MTVPEDNDLEQSAIVKDLLQTLVKTRKNLRMYPDNNPIYIKIVDDMHRKFESFFEYADSLELRIGRNDITFENEPVLQSTGKEDNFALFFFRDGLREIKFTKGLDREELHEFLKILSVDFDSDETEDDIVTLLWDKDLPNIKYKIDETVLVEDENYEETATQQATEGALAEESISEAHVEAPKAPASADFVVMPISETDTEGLSRLIEADSSEKNEKFIELLFDILYLAESIEELTEIVKVINSSITFYAKRGDIQTVVAIIGRVKSIMDSANSEPAKKQLNYAITYAGTTTVIGYLLEHLDTDAGIPEQYFKDYASYLGVSSMQPLIDGLSKAKTKRSKSMLMTVLVMLGKKDITPLIRGLREEKLGIVMELIYIIRLTGNNNAVDMLSKTARQGDSRIRKEVLNAIGELGGQGAGQIIKEYLNDPERMVRISALKALGKIGGEYSKRSIMERIADKSFMDYEFEEIKAHFEVLSRWGDEAVGNFLIDIIRKTPLLNRAKYNEIKACAIYCLGLTGMGQYMDELIKIRDSKAKVLSDYAATAIKRIEHAREGR